jgi:hypothetical protein
MNKFLLSEVCELIDSLSVRFVRVGIVLLDVSQVFKEYALSVKLLGDRFILGLIFHFPKFEFFIFTGGLRNIWDGRDEERGGY